MPATATDLGRITPPLGVAVAGPPYAAATMLDPTGQGWYEERKPLFREVIFQVTWTFWSHRQMESPLPAH